MIKPERTSLLLLAIAVGAAAVTGCLLCYQFDNKYTAPRPIVSGGAVIIDELTLTEHPAVILVDGWMVYEGLLSPEDFNGGNPPQPDATTYIGQYGGFESYLPDGTPYGSVTYRLVLKLPAAPRYYTLELPEIFSAYKAYADGELLARMGDPDPENYFPETLNTTITFEAGGKTEIVIAVTDFSHLYSGMIYPPAFGLPQAVSKMLSARFLFHALLCAAALTIGLLSAAVGLLNRRARPALLFGLLCLFFVGNAVYPLVKTFISGYNPFYAFENFSFCAMLLTAGLLLHGVSEVRGRRALVFPVIGALICISSVTLHLALARPGDHALPVIYGYSLLIRAYIWITAAYLTFLSARAVMRGIVNSKPVFSGIIIFDAALIMDRILLPYEPIITDWFPELASFALILCIGASVGAEIAWQYRHSAEQSERARGMEHLLQTRQSYYAVLDEKMEDTRALRHDLRHHISTLDGMIADKQYDRLEEYLAGYKTGFDAAAPKEYSRNRIVNVLANHYSSLAERQGCRFELRCDLDGDVPVADADFSALLCNLIENAIEACGRSGSDGRFIQVGISRAGSVLSIRVANSADTGLTNSGASRYASAKAEGRTGYGLYSIIMIAKKYSGQAVASWDEPTRVFTNSVTLFLHVNENP